jgi:hypothetical protein
MDASQALRQSLEAQAAAAIAQARSRPAPTMAYFWKEYNPDAKVLYIHNHDEANAELSKLGAGPQALGFDMEWKPNYVKGASENPVALVQLANGDTTFLLQISAMRGISAPLEIHFTPKVIMLLSCRIPLPIDGGVGESFDCENWSCYTKLAPCFTQLLPFLRSVFLLR